MNTDTFFNNYCENFSRENPENADAFELKKIHSINVSSEAEKIGISLGLSGDDIELARLIGLLHDLGRFPQFKKYKTFNDRLSTDHGKLSAIETIRTGIIQRFNREERGVVISSLFFHNKKDLPLFAEKPKKRKDERKSLFLKIIRDADKLDILRVMIDRYEKRYEGKSFIEMGLPDTGIVTDKIIHSIKNHIHASIEDVSSLTDLKLLQISWIFDMNFNFSIKEMKKREIIEKIFATIPKSSDLDFLIPEINKYIDGKITKDKKQITNNFQ